MPFNSFDDYPMSWTPERSNLHRPIYVSLADALERDVKSGRIAPNTKLPPQRELADFLDLNLSTVFKAYKLCEQRGLIRAVVGKGSFVAPSALANTSVVDNVDHFAIDMGSVHPFYELNHVIRDKALESSQKTRAGNCSSTPIRSEPIARRRRAHDGCAVWALTFQRITSLSPLACRALWPFF